MYISEIVQYLEQVAPSSYQESYDNSGLIIGNRDTMITRALITLDVTEEVIQEAISESCELIIAHHPIIFSGIKKLNGNGYVERCVIKAIKHDIAIYAIHTNLDNIYEGVNYRIAEKLGLLNCEILAPKEQQLCKLVTYIPTEHTAKMREALCEAGAGHIGNYDMCSYSTEGIGTFRGNELSNPFVGKAGEIHQEKETRLEVILPAHLRQVMKAALLQTHPYEEPAFDFYPLLNESKQVGAGLMGELPEKLEMNEWLEYLKTKMDLSCIRYTNFDARIKKIAVCGGAGSFLLKQAIRSKADVFVTADFKYHEFFDAENKLMICDIGHYESEIFTRELLRDKLLKKFPTFAAQISNTQTNPVKYFF
jgi:dinuclear metal center YbgI/SA1388 family protein